MQRRKDVDERARRPDQGEPTMRTKPCLTSSELHKAIAACRAEAQRNNWRVSIAIFDDGGHLLQFERMDGAGPMSAEVALRKARAAALARLPTKFWEDRVKERPGFASFPADILIQGGLPIMYENECVGGIGVSGVLSHEDEKVAQAGIDALAQRD